MINKTAIEYLKGLDNGLGGVLAELIDVFFQHTPGLLSKLQAHVNEWQAKEVEQVAHRLKGSSLNLGAEEVAKHFGKLEELGRNDAPSEAKTYLELALKEFEIVEQELLELKKEVSS